MNTFYIIIILLFIGACFYSAYVYFQEHIKKKDRVFIENQEFFKKKKLNDSQLYLFYTDWCPHCKKTIDIWNDIEHDYTFKKYKMYMVKINCDDKENQALVKDFNINEYPTIVLSLNNKKYI